MESIAGREGRSQERTCCNVSFSSRNPSVDHGGTFLLLRTGVGVATSLSAPRRPRQEARPLVPPRVRIPSAFINARWKASQRIEQYVAVSL